MSSAKFFTIALLTLSSSALPTRRGGSGSSQSAEEFMQNALSTFLQSQSVTSFAPLTGWQAITFAGNDAASNNALYKATDSQVDVTQPGGSAMFFSQKYVDYVEALTQALAMNGSLSAADQQSLDDSQTAYDSACGLNSTLTQTLNALLPAYIASTGSTTSSTSDPDFLQYASMNNDYQRAQDECSSANTQFEAEMSTLYGDDNAVFQGAINNIKPIQSSALNSGITMQISSVKGVTGAGTVKPYYNIPVLNGTLTAWQSNTHHAPAFNSGNSSVVGSTSSSSSSGGAGISFIWEAVSGSGSGSGSSTKNSSSVTAQSYQVSFGQIALMEIDRGIWFDNWASAAAIESPADDIDEKGVPVFQKYFGTADKPGSLTAYKDQALVVYQPSFSLQFSSASQASKFYTASASASACFLFICASGSGSKTTSNTHYEEGSSLVTYNDTSSNAYIVGYTYKHFWDGSSS